MGWFLTNATPRKSSRRGGRAASAGAWGRWDLPRTLAGLKVLAVLFALAAAALGWHRAERYLRGYVARHTAKPIMQERIELADAPAWMSPALAEELRLVVAFELGEDPMDGRSLQNAARALAASPWVAAVDRLERQPGGRCRVIAEYRRPVAVVETDQGYQLVDAGGVVLPQRYHAAEVAAVGLKPIEGVRTVPPPPGQRWDDPRLAAALKLVTLIERQPWVGQVRSIDAGRDDQRGRIRLVLHTDRNGVVTWGLPPGEEHPIEPAATTKLQWLAQVHARSGRIDHNGGSVNVFSAAAYAHGPASP